MKASENAINMIKHFEGLELEGYTCAAGYPTVGYGHRTERLVGKITLQEAEDLLKSDLEKFSGKISARAEKDGIKLNQNEFDALVDFCFNLGEGNLFGSTLWKKLKAGDHESAANEFLKWNKAHVKGKVVELNGLTRRRQAERSLFLGRYEDLA